MDDSRRSNQPERRREERDGLLPGWWQWDRGAEGWYHPRWESCLKLDCLMFYLSLNNTLKNCLFFVHRFSLRKWYCSLLQSRSRTDEIQARWEVLCCSRLRQTEHGIILLVWCTWHLKQVSDQVNFSDWAGYFVHLLFLSCLQVRRHQFMGSQVIKIFSAKDDEVRVERPTATLLGTTRWYWYSFLSEQHAGVALSALIRALDELNMVAIVRYAYDRRSNPQVGAAFPCIKSAYEVRSQSPKHAV